MKKLVLITIFLGIELLANNISKEDLGKALFLMLIYQKIELKVVQLVTIQKQHL